MWNARRNGLLPGLLLAASLSSCVDEPSLGCLARLDLEGAVQEAFSPEAKSALEGVSGLKQLAAEELPEGWAPGPWYPFFAALEFRFLADIPEVEANRAALCDVLEAHLDATCKRVQRNDLAYSCSFLVESAGYTGTLLTFPDHLERSPRTLIIVASEW